VPGSQGFHGEKPIFFRRSLRTAPRPPEAISECGSVLLFVFVSDAIGGRSVLMLGSWEQVILI
jgi:hypothetical protein